MNPYFSILIPAYNVGNYLEKCLDSVKRQTYTNWETIIVDDGSTDKTGKICDCYSVKDSRFTVIHQNNAGVASTRNVLLNRAKGKFTIFLDGDDFWNSVYMLEEIKKTAEEQEADIIAWWCKRVNDITGKVILETNHIMKSAVIQTGPEFLENVLSYGQMRWWGWLYAFKRELWIKAGIKFNKSRVVCEDEEILVHLFFEAERVWVIEKFYYSYRIFREKSATGSVSVQSIEDMLEVAEKNIHFVEENTGISDSLKKKLVANYANTLMSVGPDLYQFQGIQRQQIYEYLYSSRWMLKKLSGYGGIKHGIKIFIVRIGGIRVGFALLRMLIKFRKIFSEKNEKRGDINENKIFFL